MRSLAERTRALSEIRDRLRFFETSELAEVAAYLAESTESLAGCAGEPPDRMTV